MTFVLPKLPYGYDALEPAIDAMTMEIHHSKHHAAYTNNLNAAIKGTKLENSTDIIEVLKNLPDNAPAIRNNAGGFFNHNIYWQILSPKKTELKGELKTQIEDTFKGFDNFKAEFSKAAAGRFGSGWAWLNRKNDGALIINSTPNQDNPIMTDHEITPILGIDVWEHAYYLKYQNRRAEYIDAFFSIVNWDRVAELNKGESVMSFYE